MGKIVILDENTSNKIAAGEVIERPASVVKELLENSIDAGASSISVEVKNGGITFIKVTDNGSGIDEDDAEIAFERHATSKIRNANDLDSIGTLGFRGEALASIAAVAQVELSTRIQKNPHGIYVCIEGGHVKDVKQTGCPVGTTFAISNLFYNTPARYKFLKKDSTEFGYISEIINRVALANPQISFKLIGNNSTVLHTPGNNDLLSTIFSIYGKEISKSVSKIDYQDGKFRISGYAGKPEISRATRDHLSLFINGRYIKSKIISAAIDEAYKTFLMKNKHPFIVLNLELNPMMVDVNVHPTKMEVRFSEEQEVFRSVYHAVENALLSQPLVKDVQLQEKQQSTFRIQNKELPKINYAQQNIDIASHYVKEATKKSEPTKKVENKDINIVSEQFEKEIKAQPDVLEVSQSKKEIKPEMAGHKKDPPKLEEDVQTLNIKKNEGIDLKEKAVEQEKESKRECEEGIEAVQNLFLDAIIIGQAFSTYILLQLNDELILIDQHAAHERIMYEKFKEKYSKQESLSQMLLAPVVIELTCQEIKFLEEKKEFFNRLGFIYENFGNNSIILRAVPSIDDMTSIKELFLDVMDAVIKKDKTDHQLIADETLYTIACKAAVKANKRLDQAEIKSIMEQLSKIRNPYTCPHGRPVIIRITKYEIEKMFKRIV